MKYEATVLIDYPNGSRAVENFTKLVLLLRELCLAMREVGDAIDARARQLPLREWPGRRPLPDTLCPRTCHPSNDQMVATKISTRKGCISKRPSSRQAANQR
jgi:hypothetical protein